jgi:hypothetical protein
MTRRRDFKLPDRDLEFLNHLGLEWEAIRDHNAMWVIVYAMPLPPGYGRERVDVAIEILPGYPVSPLDMAYFYPSLARTDGLSIPNSDCMRPIGDKSWQRWSRHRAANNPWDPEQDDLDSHTALVHDWLEREFRR